MVVKVSHGKFLGVHNIIDDFFVTNIVSKYSDILFL